MLIELENYPGRILLDYFNFQLFNQKLNIKREFCYDSNLILISMVFDDLFHDQKLNRSF